MKYNVSVSSSSNLNVEVKNFRIKKSVDVDTAVDVIIQPADQISLSELSDVNPTDKQNNYLLMWDAATQKHVYVPPSEVLDRADGVNDDSLDYGSY